MQRVAVAMLPTNFAAARDGNLRARPRSGPRNLPGSARGCMLHFRTDDRALGMALHGYATHRAGSAPRSMDLGHAGRIGADTRRLCASGGHADRFARQATEGRWSKGGIPRFAT